MENTAAIATDLTELLIQPVLSVYFPPQSFDFTFFCIVQEGKLLVGEVTVDQRLWDLKPREYWVEVVYLYP